MKNSRLQANRKALLPINVPHPVISGSIAALLLACEEKISHGVIGRLIEDVEFPVADGAGIVRAITPVVARALDLRSRAPIRSE